MGLFRVGGDYIGHLNPLGWDLLHSLDVVKGVFVSLMSVSSLIHF